jgi:hypothetical protein
MHSYSTFMFFYPPTRLPCEVVSSLKLHINTYLGKGRESLKLLGSHHIALWNPLGTMIQHAPQGTAETHADSGLEVRKSRGTEDYYFLDISLAYGR